ncbi:MAG: hypothetical protein AAFX06_15625 [Planctomycetota bacterium]
MTSPKAPAEADQTSTLERLLADFTSDANGSFFGQPAKPAEEKAAATVVRPQVTIRLIGILGQPSKPQRALLKFDDKMVTLASGQAHDEIELVSFNERSVTLRGRDGEWTISLLDQPGQEAAATAPPQRQRRSQKVKTPGTLDLQDTDFRDAFTRQAAPLQDDFGGIGPSGEFGGPELPGLDQAFDAPDLAELEL